MKYRLKKDVVIPAGTVFDTAPVRTERAISEEPFDGSIDTIIGLTKDTSGTFTYALDPMDREALEEHFQPVENGCAGSESGGDAVPSDSDTAEALI
jgi:hypothetical protein